MTDKYGRELKEGDVVLRYRISGYSAMAEVVKIVGFTEKMTRVVTPGRSRKDLAYPSLLVHPESIVWPD